MLSTIAGLTGTLSCEGKLSGTIEGLTGTLFGTLSTTTPQNEYDGPYEVMSDLFEDEEMKTKDKVLTQNITVKKVAFVETSNESDGITVYIGNQN